MDPQDLIEDLPQNLRQSLLLYTYYPMIQSLKLLQLDANFTAAIVTELKLLKLIKNEILYREEDPAQEGTLKDLYCYIISSLFYLKGIS